MQEPHLTSSWRGPYYIYPLERYRIRPRLESYACDGSTARNSAAPPSRGSLPTKYRTNGALDNKRRKWCHWICVPGVIESPTKSAMCHYGKAHGRAEV